MFLFACDKSFLLNHTEQRTNSQGAADPNRSFDEMAFSDTGIVGIPLIERA
jgi:hypothetical protein